MVKNITLFILCPILVSCTYYIPKDSTGEPVVDTYKMYTFKKKMSIEDSKLIDTTACYIAIPNKDWNQEQKNNPMILQFHNDGFF